jgi:hypothetical protein
VDWINLAKDRVKWRALVQKAISEELYRLGYNTV